MKNFNQKIQEKFAQMSLTGKLFRANLTGQQVWDIYLNAFAQEDNPVFRDPASSVHNCNYCNSFIRRYGNIVAVTPDFKLETMFDVEADPEYANSARAISEAIRNASIDGVFFETFEELKALSYGPCSKNNTSFQLGVASNIKRYTQEEAEKFGVVKANEVRTFNHMHLQINAAFVDKSGKSVESLMSGYRDAKQVFQRAMETIPLDTLRLVRDLVLQGSLLDGSTHVYKIDQIIPLKEEYDQLPAEQRDNWCWVKSYQLPFAKFRNELIGVLCTELAEGEDLNKACQAWNKRVDPANYMKATAPITKKQIEEAQLFVEQNGYVDSFSRRFATIDDIKVSEILHSNVGNGALKSVSIFDTVKPTTTSQNRNEFEGIESVPIDKFMVDILPHCSGIEAFLHNRLSGNLVSLTTAAQAGTKRLFKWDNDYSWTFNGNLAGKSQIKEAVKSAGGAIDGILRFSMIWNEGGPDNSDLDAWCAQPDGYTIGYNTGFRKDSGNRFSTLGGQLDVDNRYPGGKLAVENIYFTNRSQLKDGTYRFWVNQYSAHNSQGFKAEIEVDGEQYTYVYDRPVKGNVPVAEVTLLKGVFTVKHLLPETQSASKEVYGLTTNRFHKVNLVCLSPNHWGTNQVGNKHYLFMLEGCKSPSAIRGFHNENLVPELAQHRKVLEVLGATNLIESTEGQLSGLGFNATVRDELIVRLQGSHKRVVKIQF